VVALARGGALESVIDGENGVLFDEATVPALAAAFERVGRTRFDPGHIRATAQRFSRERHVARLRQVIDETLEAPAGRRW
jgi:glycosyltransferase involved in cell wall biosynthesis